MIGGLFRWSVITMGIVRYMLYNTFTVLCCTIRNRSYNKMPGQLMVLPISI